MANLEIGFTPCLITLINPFMGEGFKNRLIRLMVSDLVIRAKIRPDTVCMISRKTNFFVKILVGLPHEIRGKQNVF